MTEKRYHIIIASVVFAILVWLSINMGYEYTLSYQIPVQIENIKKGKALRYPIPKAITVRLRGNGWELASLHLASDISYHIDLSSLNANTYVITARNFGDHVRLPLSLHPVDVLPETLVLALDDYVETTVPVIPRVIVSTKEGFGQVGETRVVPESVVLAGAKAIVDTIDRWATEYRRYENQRAAIEEEIMLEEPAVFGMEIRPRSARILVDVQPFAEKTISGIPLVATHTPMNREVVFIPPRVDIIVRGGIDRLAKLSAEHFSANIDYDALAQDSSGVVVPDIVAPEQALIIRKTPERFQFIIRKKL